MSESKFYRCEACGDLTAAEDRMDGVACANCGIAELKPVEPGLRELNGPPTLYLDGEAANLGGSDLERLLDNPPADVQLEFDEVTNGYTSSGWLNSAAIRFQEEHGEQSVSVSISCGDPRGAFVMSLIRSPDGTLRLSVPHPDDSTPHMTLKDQGGSSGFYVVQ